MLIGSGGERGTVKEMDRLSGELGKRLINHLGDTIRFYIFEGVEKLSGKGWGGALPFPRSQMGYLKIFINQEVAADEIKEAQFAFQLGFDGEKTL